MADSKLGTIAARQVILDRGTQAHYGPDDDITGKVVIKYLGYTSFIKKSPGTLDYFGPLKIEVVLSGKVRVKIRRSSGGSGTSSITSDYSTRLFLQKFTVYDGTFKASVGEVTEFPFAINFPESAQDSPLPPSIGLYFSDFAERVDTAVVYRLAVELSPGVKADTSVPDRIAQPDVKYDHPQPPRLMYEKPVETFQQRIIVRNKYLLPEEERPSGFRKNFKAAFSSNSDLPTFVANITCTTLPQAFVGLRPRFSLAVRRVDKDTTAPFFPEAILHSFEINLIAHTEVDTSERILSSKSCFDASSVQKLKPSSESSALPVSLSKANDYSVEVALEPFGSHPSTFSHPKISRKYVLEIEAVFKIADDKNTLFKQFAIEFLPPPPGQKELGASDPSQPVEAGPSRIAVDEEMDQLPPAYDDAPAYGDSTRVKGEEG